jgi:hypothetical protein
MPRGRSRAWTARSARRAIPLWGMCSRAVPRPSTRRSR